MSLVEEIRANRQVWRECLCPTHTAIRDLAAEVERLRLWHCTMPGERVKPCGACAGCKYTYSLGNVLVAEAARDAAIARVETAEVEQRTRIVAAIRADIPHAECDHVAHTTMRLLAAAIERGDL